METSLNPQTVFRAGLDGPRLGLGGAALGNLYQAVSDAQVRALLDAAWDDGCRSFDTAPHYGHGLSERRMGDALRTHERATFSLSSKVGRLLTPDRHAPAEQHGYVQTLPFVQRWDFSGAGIRRSIEDSLQRLGLAYLDTVFIHDMDAQTQGERAEAVFRQVLDDALPALAGLKAEGLLQHVGLGVNDHAIVCRVLEHADLDAVLLAGRYTLLDTSALPTLMPLLQCRGVALALGGVFNSGMLAKRIDTARPLTFNYAPAQQVWIDRAVRLQAVCDRHGVPIEAAALQFAMHHPATQLVLLGARSAQEWHHARQAVNIPIPADCWAEMRHEGLLPEEAPHAMIDAHFHCWQLDRGDYGWLTPALGPIHRDVRVSDWSERALAHGITGGVLVQAAPTEPETHYLLAQADQHPQVLGVVGWVDMTAPDAGKRIGQLSRHPALKGLRPMLQDMDDPDWILQPALTPALQAMAHHGLVFDALIRPVHLPRILALIERHPQLRLVIDHGAKPSPQGAMADWARGMQAIARNTDPARVACKFSGLWTELPAGAGSDGLTPWCETLLSVWGPQRLIWGSDWPVLELAADYARWFTWTMAFLRQRCTPEQCQAVLEHNARRMYRL